MSKFLKKGDDGMTRIIRMIQSVLVSNEKKMELFNGTSVTPSTCRMESHMAYNFNLHSIFH
jgi:hypothetical protein